MWILEGEEREIEMELDLSRICVWKVKVERREEAKKNEGRERRERQNLCNRFGASEERADPAVQMREGNIQCFHISSSFLCTLYNSIYGVGHRSCLRVWYTEILLQSPFKLKFLNHLT